MKRVNKWKCFFNSLGIVFLLIGLLGFYWILFGSATIAVFYYLVSFKFLKKNHEINKNRKISFEVLIAAYNEQINLPYTLESLEKLKIDNQIDFKVYVGLDHCTDGTLDIVKKYQNEKKLSLRYFENEGDRGKWFIIKQLIQKSDADWVALTDCGAVWNEDVLKAALDNFYNDNLICLAPSYLPDRAGLLEKTYWRLEQVLRTIENLSKGSIMVHGPTVFYRRTALLLAIDLLGSKHWINDDVAIPLVLRNHNKNFEIKYFASLNHIAWIRDKGVVSDVNIELKRRRRILIGNIQCATDIIIPKFNPFKLITLTSSRLLSKILWAYWVTIFVLGMISLVIGNYKLVIDYLSSHSNVSFAFIAMIFGAVIVSVKSNYVHRLFMAYISGLQINKAVKALENPKKIVWS